jgi:hypothetical protein
VPFYFINLLPTSLLYISILLTKIGRYEKRTLSAPVAVFARLVLFMLSDVFPVGKWSMSRLAVRRPGLVDEFDGLKVCQAFASCTELREAARDLLLGRDTQARRADPVFHELLYPPDFARFQPLPQVNLKQISHMRFAHRGLDQVQNLSPAIHLEYSTD